MDLLLSLSLIASGSGCLSSTSPTLCARCLPVNTDTRMKSTISHTVNTLAPRGIFQGITRKVVFVHEVPKFKCDSFGKTTLFNLPYFVLVIVWQRFCEPARLRIAHCPSVIRVLWDIWFCFGWQYQAVLSYIVWMDALVVSSAIILFFDAPLLNWGGALN